MNISDPASLCVVVEFPTFLALARHKINIIMRYLSGVIFGDSRNLCLDLAHLELSKKPQTSSDVPLGILHHHKRTLEAALIYLINGRTSDGRDVECCNLVER